MIDRLNPAALPTSPAFAQGTVATGSRTVYVGGQNGIDATGALADGAQKQSEQALRNVLAVLGEAGATQADVAKMTVHLVESVDPREAFGAVAGVWGRHPTAVTVLRVAGLAVPGALVEIDAIAVLPSARRQCAVPGADHASMRGRDRHGHLGDPGALP